MLRDSRTFTQLWRYGVVGVASNLLLYLAYLAITAIGLEHKLAMTVTYVTGVAMTFVFNRNWTFGHSGPVPGAVVRYFAIYGLGYVVNWALLYLLVDQVGLDHRWVQGVLIFVVAGMLFVLQKLVVFRSDEHAGSEP